MGVQKIDGHYRPRVDQILKDEWHCPPSVSLGNAIDTRYIPGFVFVEDEDIKGVITYNIKGDGCEIATLNSFCDNKGIGGALIDAVKDTAREAGCKRLWLVTSNDNIRAIGFYQKRGFELFKVHINSMDEARKIKPSIPLTGMDGIPLKHEFEFEMML